MNKLNRSTPLKQNKTKQTWKNNNKWSKPKPKQQKRFHIKLKVLLCTMQG